MAKKPETSEAQVKVKYIDPRLEGMKKTALEIAAQITVASINNSFTEANINGEASTVNLLENANMILKWLDA